MASFARPRFQIPGKSRHRAKQNSVLNVHNITVFGRRTSIRLEPEIWAALGEMCRREFCTPNDICTSVAERKNPRSSLTSALRVTVLDYFRQSATEDGHYRSGHGQGIFMGQTPPRWIDAGGSDRSAQQSIGQQDFQKPPAPLKPAD